MVFDKDNVQGIIVEEDDGNGFSNGSSGVVGLKDLVIRHLRKISDLTTQEMTAGYWQERPVNTGGGIVLSQVWIPDGRKAYCSSVDFLEDFLMPNADDEFKKFMFGDKFEEYIKTKEIKDLGGHYKKIDDEFEDFKNKAEDEWVQRKLEMKREVFAKIMLMIGRINYFGEEQYKE